MAYILVPEPILCIGRIEFEFESVEISPVKARPKMFSKAKNGQTHTPASPRIPSLRPAETKLQVSSLQEVILGGI